MKEDTTLCSIPIPTPTTKPHMDNKKRGRKPKGGKIISKPSLLENPPTAIPNIILHLKCSLHDLEEFQQKKKYQVKTLIDPLQYSPDVPPPVKSYNTNENNVPFSIYQEKEEDITTAYKEDIVIPPTTSLCNVCNCCNSNKGEKENEEIQIKENLPTPPNKEEEKEYRELNRKLNRLKHYYYKGQHQQIKHPQHDKKPSCFWCSYEYDNETYFIPKYEVDGCMYGYGSFCTPECGVAFLMKENIDDTIKFERYNILNNIYGKLHDYKKNIKPAPNPHYLLEKFYGSLTIQEYRRLLRTNHLLTVLDKPMTRILPEIHEDNEDLSTVSIYGGRFIGGSTESSSPPISGGGVYKVKRQNEKPKGPSKSSIMKDTFGFS